MPGEAVGWTPEQRAEFKALLGEVESLSKRAGGSLKKKKKRPGAVTLPIRKGKGYKKPKPKLLKRDKEPINIHQQRQLRRLEREQY